VGDGVSRIVETQELIVSRAGSLVAPPEGWPPRQTEPVERRTDIAGRGIAAVKLEVLGQKVFDQSGQPRVVRCRQLREQLGTKCMEVSNESLELRAKAKY
jgi:hypothetical protein